MNGKERNIVLSFDGHEGVKGLAHRHMEHGKKKKMIILTCSQFENVKAEMCFLIRSRYSRGYNIMSTFGARRLMYMHVKQTLSKDAQICSEVQPNISFLRATTAEVCQSFE